MIQLAPLLLALTVAGVPMKAGVLAVEIHGNQYIAKILTSPNNYEALLVLTFEAPDASLLSTSVAVSATEVDPTVLQARLPSGAFLPARFPVVVQVDQGGIAGVTFQNGYTVELITRHLALRSHSPLRLFKAPDGGSFADVSNSIGFGSFRARGSAGSFSEFVIAADMRPDAMVIDKKFLALKTLLDNNNGGGISVGTYNTLDSRRADAVAAYQADNLPLAIGHVESMLDVVDAEAGNTIEASYTGGSDESLAGSLSGLLESLRASLELLALGEPAETETVTRRLTTGNGHRLLVEVTFKGRQAIDLDQLAITADDLSALDLIALAPRLPAGVQVPAELPVLIHVDPGSNAEQTFRGEVQFEVTTDEIDFFGDSLVRLFKAPDGGLFRDVTGTYGIGSFRARGSSGSFSELILARDLRGASVIRSAKLLDLQSSLTAHVDDIDAGVYALLTSLLDSVDNALLANDLVTAKSELDDFVNLVEAESGNGVPDIWVSTVGSLRVNVAARLLSAARTLCLSLTVERSPDADPADANRDGVVDELDVFYVLSRVFPSPS